MADPESAPPQGSSSTFSAAAAAATAIDDGAAIATGSASPSTPPDDNDEENKSRDRGQPSGTSPDSEDLLHKVRNLMRRITAARPSPHPRFLHNLASILEQEESRFEKEVGHPASNSARSAHTIGRLITLIRENDDFFELLSSKLLVESRHSTAVQAGAARLLLACLSCGMHPDVFEEAVLANIKRWAIEDPPKSAAEVLSPKKPGSSRLRKVTSFEWEMLRTFNLGLLAVALTTGGGIVEEVLASGVAAKLMHYLRLRVLKESSNQKDAQFCDSRPSGSSVLKTREDTRNRARLSLEARDGEECRERILPGGSILEEGSFEERISSESYMERSNRAYDADDDTDWIGDEKWKRKDKRDSKTKLSDSHGASRSGRDDDIDEAGRGEASKRKGDNRERAIMKARGKGRGGDGFLDGEKLLTSPNAGVRIRNTKEKEVHKTEIGSDSSKLMDGSTMVEDVDFGTVEAEKEFDEQDGSAIVGDVDISVHVRRAARAAEAEAKAAKASHEAVKAAGEAAMELVKAAAMEALDQSLDKETVLEAATSAAATVVDAAVATRAMRKTIDLSNNQSVEEKDEDKEEAEIEFAELGDCVPDAERLASLKERFSVQCLERLGEYLEVLGPVLHERGVDVCLALLQRESADGLCTKDTAMLADVLKLICALAAHRKFSALFVDRGGVQQILAVPRLPQTYTGISLCLFAFASVPGVMERVCTAPAEVLKDVVSLGLQLLECAQDPARRNAALFFGAAFVFRAILDVFDAQDGLYKMLNLLRNAAAIRSGTGVPGPSSTSRSDRAASAEVLTSSEKQIAYHTCVALRQYFRAHLLILVDSHRPCKGKGGSRNYTGGRAAYKPLDLSNEVMDTLVLQIQRDRKLGPVFVRARWPALEKFMSYSGHVILLELTQVPPGERYLHDIAQHALGVLQIVTLMPYTRRLIVTSTLSNDRSGMAVILDAASVTSFAEPEVIQSALLVLVNLVCPPPSLSSRPNLPPNTPSAQPPFQNTGGGNMASLGESKERLTKGEGISDKTALDRSTQGDDMKERASRGDATVEKTAGVPGTSAAAAVVGDRRISLGSVAGGSGLAAYMEQGYRQARDSVRANNGIKVLLHLLYPRTVFPPMSLDCIRALACRVLLGLAKDDAIAHILTKLQVGKLLSELLREGNSHLGRAPPSNGAGEQGRWQAELGQVSMELMAIVTNAGRASTLAASDAAAPTLRRIERAAIAAATPITYPARDLLQLIHEHLVLSGLSKSASALLDEAQLAPLPSAVSQTMVLNHSSALDTSQEPLEWPAGRVPSGFLVDVSKASVKEDATVKSDQVLGSARKKGPSFSSSLMTGQRPSQSTPLSIKEFAGQSLESKQTAGRTEKIQEFHISGSRLGDSEYADTPRTAATSSSGVSAKRKLTDRDPCPLPTPKRFAMSDAEGSPFASITSKCSQAHDGRSLASTSQCQNHLDVLPRLEKPETSHLQIDLMAVENNQVQVPSSFSTPVQPQASPFPHPNLFSEPQTCQNERATLDSLVVQYLKHQHRQCPAPITTLPPLSLFHPHVCPEPRRACYAPFNTTRRLAAREMVPPYGGTQGRRRNIHFVYSRFRPLRPCRDESVLLTTTSFLGTTFRLAAGSHAGEIRLFDCHSGNLLETHVCHQSPITLLQCASGELGGSLEFTGSQPGHLLLSSGSYDVKLWNSSALGDVPLYSFEGCRSARFNHSGSMFAAISAESHREVLLYDVQTGTLEQRLSDSSSSSAVLRGSGQCIAHFNSSDTVLLWNGVLWDHRVPRAVHKFDQFTDYGGGGFHPTGNEVIINSEVWDLRAFKLLRSVPSLDQTVITFNATGDVIYATLRRNSEDITSALNPRRGKNLLFSAFKTLDAMDYTDIATTSVDRCVLDLATEPSDTLISVVALDGHDEMDSFAKLYEVGRRKPTDDDSDPDDGVETEDDEDSLAEEEAAEEEGLHGDDDTDFDVTGDEDGTGDEDEAEEDVDADFDTNDEDDDDMVEVDGSIVELFSDGDDDDTRISYSSDDGSAGDFDEDFNEMLQGFF